MEQSTTDRLRRRIAENLQQTGFHYHGDFRDIVAILARRTDIELSVLDNFVEDVLAAEHANLAEAMALKGESNG